MSTAVAVPILTARASRINAAHSKSVAAGRSMLLWAIEAGKELIEAKKSVPRGEFVSWCRANLSFSYDTAKDYMKIAKKGACPLFDGASSIRAALAAIESPRPSAFPAITLDDAQRLLKLARMSNGGNEHEEAVAQEMLDRMAARFGMTGEEAQAAAEKLCPEPPSFDEQTSKAEAFNAKLDERVAAIRTEIISLIEREGRDEALTIIAETICRLKFPKEYRSA